MQKQAMHICMSEVKMINVNVWLYRKPAWDMDIEGEEEIYPEMLKEQGNYLKKHLDKVADIVKKLKSAGWDCHGTLYDLDFLNKTIKTEEEAKQELKRLGISLKEVSIMEFEDEEEFGEEDLGEEYEELED